MNTNAKNGESVPQQTALSATPTKAAAAAAKSHEFLLAELLLQIKAINFRERAGFAADDEKAKLQTRHYLIITVEEVLRIAKANHWDLCRRDGLVFLYNGAFWKSISGDDLRKFLREAAERMGVEKFMARHVNFAKQLLEQFTETAYLPVPAIDRDTVRVNLTNGTFEIGMNRQQLRPFDSKDFLTHLLPFAYDPSAKAPLFETYLDRVLPDVECQCVLSEFLGYVFINPARLKLEKALLLYGSGANGKSVFFEIVTALLGKENICHFSLHSLTKEPAYSRADLATKLVNYASEINGKLEADAFKQMVSGEPIEARLPYGQPFIMRDYAKLIFNCNDLPSDVEHTPAYFRRFLIVPFNVTIPEQEQDKKLSQKIIANELPGVFNWVLEGLRRLLAQGRFMDAQAVREQIENYQKQSDTVRLFLDEQGYEARHDNYEPLQDFYRSYRAFCVEDGYRAISKKNFKKRLESLGIDVHKRSVGQVVFVGRKRDTP